MRSYLSQDIVHNAACWLAISHGAASISDLVCMLTLSLRCGDQGCFCSSPLGSQLTGSSQFSFNICVWSLLFHKPLVLYVAQFSVGACPGADLTSKKAPTLPVTRGMGTRLFFYSLHWVLTFHTSKLSTHHSNRPKYLVENGTLRNVYRHFSCLNFQ